MPLREVIDINFAKADMVIHKDFSGVFNEDDIDKLAQTCVIQGTVSVGSFPKWR